MKRPRHILMVLLDGLRVDALDTHPVFDQLRKRGLFCGNMVTYAPYTTASMHAILTGIYGTRNGVDSYFSAARFKGEACRTLAQYFQGVGYFTAVDINNRHTIPCQGYERITEYDEFHPDNRFRLVERHLGLLSEARSMRRPFLLSLHNLKTHTELIQKFRERFPGEQESLYYSDAVRNAEEYRGYAREMGDYVAALLKELERGDFFRDGLLVVFSDHGCSCGEQAGERMYGTYLHDRTIKTFAFFVGVGIQPGCVRKSLMRTVDIMPTILETCGLSVSNEGLRQDGESFLDPAQDDGERWGYVETAPLGGTDPSPYRPNYHGVVSGKQKLLYHADRDDLQFFERSGADWRAAHIDSPEAEEWLFRLCGCSPRVNRKWLSKIS